MELSSRPFQVGSMPCFRFLLSNGIDPDRVAFPLGTGSTPRLKSTRLGCAPRLGPPSARSAPQTLPRPSPARMQAARRLRWRTNTSACDKNSTPLENSALGKISIQSTKPGAGEQFPLLDCRANARLNGVCFFTGIGMM